MVTGKPKLLIATTNLGKFKELSSLLSDCPFSLVSLDDVGIDVAVAESGSSFEENASLKAAAYARIGGLPTLADDSGLEVEALGGEPGIFSSRFAGPRSTDADRVAHLLHKLDNIPEGERNARFRCVIAVSWPGESPEFYSGECLGRIVRAPRGSNGFGYDPVFFLPELGRTMAELSTEEKDRVSHRGRAARKAAAALKRRAASG